MQLIFQYLSSLGVDKQPILYIGLAVVVLIGLAALAGSFYYLGRLAIGFLNPVSSRATPLFTLGLIASVLLAVVVNINSVWLTNAFPGWKVTIGAFLAFFSLCALTVAAAKLLRFAMIACLWGGLSLGLVSQICQSKPPQEFVKEHWPQVQVLVSTQLAKHPEMLAGGTSLMQKAFGAKADIIN